jgi:CRP-like cAMP-binding protein
MMEIGHPYSRLLAKLERFNSLSSEDRRLIAELPLTVVNFAANQPVYRHGDAPPCCNLVLNGFLYSGKLIGPSRRQITSLHIPGDVAGLQSLHLPYLEHNLYALGPAVVALLPHSAVKYLLDSSQALNHAFWRETFVETTILREWVANLGRREALARVAHLVCEIAVRLQAVNLARNSCFSIAWTQMDVADACGISGVHANRVVQELRHLGLVDWDSRLVKIRDWEGLVRTGEFSDDYLQLRAAGSSSFAETERSQYPGNRRPVRSAATSGSFGAEFGKHPPTQSQ